MTHGRVIRVGVVAFNSAPLDVTSPLESAPRFVVNISPLKAEVEAARPSENA